MVDVEKLIDLVHDRKPLWDPSNKSYHNRDVARKLWVEIAEEMNTTSQTVKEKWQNLRDNFRREHRKNSNAPTGSASLDNTQLSSWKYYKQLLFLIDVFSSRKLKTNIPPPATQTSNIPDATNEEVEDSIIENDTLIDPDPEDDTSPQIQVAEDENNSERDASHSTTSFRKPNIQIRRKAVKSEAINQLLSLEKRKIEHLEKLHESRKTSEDFDKDEDYYFLMSLLPHLRDVPKRRKLATRVRLQQVLMEEEKPEEVTNNSSSSSSYSYNYDSQRTTPSPNVIPPSSNVLHSYVSNYCPEATSSLYPLTECSNTFSNFK